MYKIWALRGEKCVKKYFLQTNQTDLRFIWQFIEQLLQVPLGGCAVASDGVKIIFEPQSLLLLLFDIGNQLLHGVAGVLYFTSRLAP